MPAESAAHLTVEIHNQKPIELAELSLSLLSLAKQYQKFVSRSDLLLTKEEARLVIKEVRPGSVIADLYPYALMSAGVMMANPEAIDSIKSVFDFAKYLKSTFDALLGGGKLPEQTTSKDIKEVSNILNATASDIGGSFQIKAEQGATVQVTINYNSLEANAIQNRAIKELEAMKEPEHQPRSKVLMYWFTASQGERGDKVVIEEISEKPLPVYIANDADKKRMIQGRDNPFLLGFIVDVDLIVVKDRLRGYRVTKLYEELQDAPDSTPSPRAIEGTV
jgi:hypothetical protein